MYGVGLCPRCGGGSMEYLATHSHCWQCNYFPEDNPGLRQWLNLEFRPLRPRQSEAWEGARVQHGLQALNPSTGGHGL